VLGLACLRKPILRRFGWRAGFGVGCGVSEVRKGFVTIKKVLWVSLAIADPESQLLRDLDTIANIRP
jgi:hypothetical protein